MFYDFYTRLYMDFGLLLVDIALYCSCDTDLPWVSSSYEAVVGSCGAPIPLWQQDRFILSCVGGARHLAQPLGVSSHFKSTYLQW